MKKKATKTTKAQLEAAKRYDKTVKRRRLSGSFVPIEIDALLDRIAARTGETGTTALLWHCVRTTASLEDEQES